MKVNWSQNDKIVLHKASQNMIKAGWSEFKIGGHYLTSSIKNNDIEQNSNSDKPHLGQIRVFFEYDKCGPATVVA